MLTEIKRFSVLLRSFLLLGEEHNFFGSLNERRITKGGGTIHEFDEFESFELNRIEIKSTAPGRKRLLRKKKCQMWSQIAIVCKCVKLEKLIWVLPFRANCSIILRMCVCVCVDWISLSDIYQSFLLSTWTVMQNII